MRTLLCLPLLVVLTAVAQDWPQAAVTSSRICSIPLLRAAVPLNIDPGIVLRLPPNSSRMPQVKVPAPPCDEPVTALLVVTRDRAEPANTLPSPERTLPGTKFKQGLRFGHPGGEWGFSCVVDAKFLKKKDRSLLNIYYWRKGRG